MDIYTSVCVCVCVFLVSFSPLLLALISSILLLALCLSFSSMAFIMHPAHIVLIYIPIYLMTLITVAHLALLDPSFFSNKDYVYL